MASVSGSAQAGHRPLHRAHEGAEPCSRDFRAAGIAWQPARGNLFNVRSAVACAVTAALRAVLHSAGHSRLVVAPRRWVDQCEDGFVAEAFPLHERHVSSQAESQPRAGVPFCVKDVVLWPRYWMVVKCYSYVQHMEQSSFFSARHAILTN